MTWCAYITTPSAHCQSHSESETFANFIVGSKDFRGGIWLFWEVLSKISYQKIKWGNLGPEAPTLGIATMLKWNVVKPMGCRPEKLALRGVYAAMLTLGLKNSRVKAPFSHKWQNLRQRRWSRNMEATSKSPKLSNIVARCNRLSWGGCTARRWAQCCHLAGKLNATNKAATLQRNTHRSLYLQRGQNGCLNLYNVTFAYRESCWVWWTRAKVVCSNSVLYASGYHIGIYS